MIVRSLPSFLQLFTFTQGSIAPQVLPAILGFMALSLAVVACDRLLFDLPHISINSMNVFGIALSLFLGFRNNAAYNRWWEARKLWGQFVINSRSLSLEMAIFIHDQTIQQKILRLVAVYVHLHRGKLQEADITQDACHWITPSELDAFLKHNSPPCAVLNKINDELKALFQKRKISDVGIRELSNRIGKLAAAQGGNERLSSTPLPFIYSLLIQRTAYLYCLLLPLALIDAAGWFAPLFSGVVAYIFLGLSAVTNELEHPFGQHPNALPLKSLCRIIEINIAESLGEEPLPKMQPENHLLT